MVGAMSTPEDNVQLARTWLTAFNAKDVSALVALYAEDATHTSPKIRALHPETGGKLRGQHAIGAWWRGAIARTPGLRYEEVAVTASADRVLLEYVRHADGEPPLPVAEAFDVESGRIVASRVYHG
jgi:ketosteroid isomerase-like protein